MSNNNPNLCEKAMLLINRSLDWRLRRMELTTVEVEKLSSMGITSGILQQYHMWRYSSLLSALLFVILDALFVIIDFLVSLSSSVEVFNAAGLLLFLLAAVAEICLAIAVVVGFIYCFKKPSLSIKVLTYGWLVATIVPIIPSFVPFENLLNDEYKDFYLNTVEGFIFRLSLTGFVAINIFPTIIAVPSGLIRGAMRIRGLLPMTTLAGWLIVAACPLFPLIALGSISLLVQVATGGTALLISGALLFMIAPLGFALRRRLITKPKLNDDDFDQITLTLRVICGMQVGGLVLILMWVLVNASIELGVIGILKFIVGFVGRLLVTTLVFADVVLEITASNLKETRESQEATVLGESETLLASFESQYFELAEGKQTSEPDNASTNNNKPSTKAAGLPVIMASHPQPVVVATSAVPKSEGTSWYETISNAVVPSSPAVASPASGRATRASVDP